MPDYKTRATINGLSLQVLEVSSSRYVRVIRDSDQGIVWKFDGAPFTGPLRPLYAAFIAVAAPIVAKGRDDLTPAEIATLENLRGLLVRNGPREYRLAA